MEPGRWQDTVEELRSEPDLARLASVARMLDPADLAAVLADLDEDRRRLVFTCLGDEAAAQALDEADPAIKTGLVLGMAIERAAVILDAMPADEATDLLGGLPDPRARAILRAMKTAGASQVQRLLSYPADSAGGQMTTEFISVPWSLTVQATIDRLRGLSPEAETVYDLYVVDGEDHLVGVVTLRSLIVSAPEAQLSDIMDRNVNAVPVDMGQEEVARKISRYNLLAVPVVDAQDHLLGLITVDDAVEVLDQEAGEDVHQLGDGALGHNLPLSEAWRPLISLAWIVALSLGIARAVGSLASRVELRESGVWVIAAFLPAMMMLARVFESPARGRVVSWLAELSGRTERPWRLIRDVAPGLIGIGACAAICAVCLVIYPVTNPWHGELVVGIAVGLAAGSAVAVLGIVLLSVALGNGSGGMKAPLQVVSEAAHLAGVVTYLLVALWVSRG